MIFFINKNGIVFDVVFVNISPQIHRLRKNRFEVKIIQINTNNF